jgi:hypothetical protein
MNKKKEVRMKMLRSIYQWGSLYIWFGIFTGAFFWEEKIQLNSIEHTLLEIATLLIFGLIVIGWVNSHEENFLADPYDDPSIDPNNRVRSPNKMIAPVNKR